MFVNIKRRMGYFPVGGQILGETGEAGGDFEMTAAESVKEREITQRICRGRIYAFTDEIIQQIQGLLRCVKWDIQIRLMY